MGQWGRHGGRGGPEGAEVAACEEGHQLGGMGLELVLMVTSGIVSDAHGRTGLEEFDPFSQASTSPQTKRM